MSLLFNCHFIFGILVELDLWLIDINVYVQYIIRIMSCLTLSFSHFILSMLGRTVVNGSA